MPCLLPSTARYVLVLVALVMTTPALGQAPADPSDAPSVDEMEGRARFEAGRAAFVAGRFNDALDDFQRAYRLTKNPVLLFNIGAAADRLRKDEVALEAFDAYLKQVPNAENRAEVQGRLQVLVERAAAQQSDEAVRPRPDEQQPAPPVAALPPPAPPIAAPAPSEAPARSGAPAERAGSAAGRAWPWVLTGVGGALAVSGAVLVGLGAKDKASVEDAKRGTSWSSVSDARDRAPLRIALGSAFLGIGLASVAAGLLWHFRTPRVTPSVQIGANSARVAVLGNF